MVSTGIDYVSCKIECFEYKKTCRIKKLISDVIIAISILEIHKNKNHKGKK